MINTDEGYMRLEYFSQTVAADTRRKEFDIKNHSLIHAGKHPDFLFIGDSITHYWELNLYFNRPDQLIVNRGIGGDTTAFLRKRFFVDAVQLCPRYCICGIGINDSIDLEGDYWKRLAPAPYDAVLQAAKDNIRDIVSQALSSGMKLILASLLPINIPVSLHEDMRRKYILELNGYLRQTAAQHGLIYVDHYSAMTEPGTQKVRDHITYDGLHPNALGYEIMSDILRATLRSHHISI